MKLEKIIYDFLKTHVDQPFLLALSGGPDSLCLYHLLLQAKVFFGVAHVNHNWRKESCEEAAILQRMAQANGVPFHLKALNPIELQGNLEEACRNERLKFFGELCHAHGYQAVMLGHHADDHAETVLKRIFEGSDLTLLSGLQRVKRMENLTLWRPLLGIKKVEILAWLEAKSITPFEDKTNADERFLRGRMRAKIVPELARTFGKEIGTALCHLAEESQELQEHIAKIAEPYLATVERGPYGVLLDLRENFPKSFFELKSVVGALCRREGFSLSRHSLKSVCQLLMEGKANCRFHQDGNTFFVDRRCLFLLHALPEGEDSRQLLKEGESFWGSWKIEVRSVQEYFLPQQTGWKAAWHGCVEVVVSHAKYELGQALMNAPYPGKSSISRWWNEHKVPNFLWRELPVLWQADRICGEFLSEKQQRSNCGPYLHIILSYQPLVRN